MERLVLLKLEVIGNSVAITGNCFDTVGLKMNVEFILKTVVYWKTQFNVMMCLVF